MIGIYMRLSTIEEPNDASKGRDVFNENPPHDELMAVLNIAQPVTTSLPENVHIYFARMVRVSVLNDALKSMYNAEKRGNQTLLYDHFTRNFLQDK
nr:peptidyl-prolyl cis-trans isomerase CYP71 [Tanacetum cinerariifolium]